MATRVNRIVTGKGFACNTFKYENTFDRYIFISPCSKSRAKERRLFKPEPVGLRITVEMVETFVLIFADLPWN